EEATQRKAGSEIVEQIRRLQNSCCAHRTIHGADTASRRIDYVRGVHSHRWLPLREATWRPSTRASAEHVLGLVLVKFGKVPLERLDTIAIQNWLNGLASTYSDSVVKHCRIYIKSILEEAVDQDYLRKNLAKRVT